MAPAIVPSTRPVLEQLRAFLSLEAPFLLSDLADGAPGEGLEAPLLARLDEYLADGRTATSEIHPGLSEGDAVASYRSEVELLIRGFFRRQTIKASLTADARRLMLRTMLLTRSVDELLKRSFDEKTVMWESYPSPQKGFRSLGQEAIVGAALPLRRPPVHGPGPEYDGDIIDLSILGTGARKGELIHVGIWPFVGVGVGALGVLIRDLGATLTFRPDPLQPFLVQFGKAGTPVGGRDLHVGDLEWGVLPPAAPLAVATQTLVGMAYAFKLRDQDRVCVSFIGDGGASLGEWHESINFAAVKKLGMVFVIQNNQWALGTHVSEQTAARRFALRAAGYGVPGVTIFGNDPEEIAATVGWAAERARAGDGPTVVEIVTYRRPGHAHHDDDRFHGRPEAKIPGYELTDERERWEALDPVTHYERRLIDEGVLSDEELGAMREEVADAVQRAVDEAKGAPWPDPAEYRSRVVAPPAAPLEATIEPKTKMMAYDEAVREALSAAMQADESVFVLGEDVGGRYGGAFGVTRGLTKRFGPDRCLNTPLAESAIIGCAVGAAIEGFRPVAEMQFADFLATGFNAMVNNAAKLYWRWGREVPMVVRLPYGGATGDLKKLLGGGPFHSQCPEMWFVRTPGWKIVAPSTPADAKGLMLAAIRDPNPVLFLEAKGLYGFFRTDLREEVPLGVDYEVPIGEAVVRREGNDATLLTYGSSVWVAAEAAETLARAGVEVEIIDLRSLWPLDWATIATSVRKTNRVVILHEDTRRGGFGGELAGRIADELFWALDAPVRRVTAPDTPIPYSPPLEYDFLPKATDVVDAVRTLVAE